MRWGKPGAHLEADTIYDLLVVRGLDDWLQPRVGRGGSGAAPRRRLRHPVTLAL
ncbi:hypothetical protein GCM10009868_13240 [Terrabacter aerolatus]|uniref:Uncharacterized protein n=1 Tax=Terrabacter aerolatus TaxID=422442 RepID=A0A512CYU6_9MICO|nr:hypothetical protein TAE01_09900 [Terrabacter aerolatus]